MGGHFGVTQKCQLEFAVSRMCTREEVAATAALPAGLSASAWANPFAAPSSSANCSAWKVLVHRGFQVGLDGAAVVDWRCEIPVPIACCALVP